MTNIRDVSSFSNFIGNSLCNIFYEKKNVYTIYYDSESNKGKKILESNRTKSHNTRRQSLFQPLIHPYRGEIERETFIYRNLHRKTSFDTTLYLRKIRRLFPRILPLPRKGRSSKSSNIEPSHPLESYKTRKGDHIWQLLRETITSRLSRPRSRTRNN